MFFKKSLLFSFILCFFIVKSARCSPVTDTLKNSIDSPGLIIVIKIIHFNGNKITKERIMLRELTFKENDTIAAAVLPEKFKQSRQNLLNTSLFNFVTIDTVNSDSNGVDVKIDVKERWYTWPVPIFEISERNFNTWWLKKDLSRINYGFYLTRDNFRGRKESLTLRFRLGYTELYGISYYVPYFNKKQNSGFGFSVTYSRNREIAYKTVNHQLLFYKNPDAYVRGDFGARLNYTLRKGYYDTHIADLRYDKGTISDTVNLITDNYFTGDRTSMEYLTLNYIFRRDLRDSRAYPLKGYFFDVEVSKLGLGLLRNENLNVFYVHSTYRKFWQMHDRLYLSAGLRGKISSNTFQPYSVQRGLGYRDFVRGYEYYVIDGQNFGLVKTAIKYELIKPKIQKIPFLKIEKFNTLHYALYVNLFTDAGYVQEREKEVYLRNRLANSLLFGTGLGLDLVTYYDTVFRIEYSFNKQGEKGFFLHFSAPI